MKGNGRTKAGTQRWRCPKCGASSVRKHDSGAKQLAAFLKWLLSKDAIADLKTSRATFWCKTAWAWRIWPIAPATGELHDVAFLDGIWLRRNAAVLVAVAGGHVVGWHLAQSECGSARAALMLRIPPAPKMAVSDGSPGFAAAVKAVWPNTRIQRCTFHAANQVKRCTTLKPRFGGRNRAPGNRQQAQGRQGRRLRHGVAAGIQLTVRQAGDVPQGAHGQGRQEGLHARAAPQG